MNLSYKDNILLWLKEKLLPNVRLKDIFLRSAIEQYIDHLEGMFDMRTINNKTNMELQEFIKKELRLTDNPKEENIVKLLAKREEINKVNNQMDILIRETHKEIFQGWRNTISENYKGYESVYEIGERVGLIIPVNNSTTRVRVSICYGTEQKLYCQVDIFEGENLPEEVKKRVEYLLPLKNNNNQIWQWFPNDYSGGFKCLQEVLAILIKQE